MFMVVMNFGEDLFVDAEDYAVDADGDLVFLNEDVDDEFDSEDGMVETARVVAGQWAAVVPAAAEDDDDDEDEDDEEVDPEDE